MMLALLVSVGASAQRKTWDFTKGFSATTIANLKSAGWTDETADQSIQTNARSEGPLKATVDGQEWIVPETSGLTFHHTGANHIVLAYNRTSGGYVGTKFLWINGKTANDAITIPAIPAGEKVTIVYESHSKTEDRGFKVSGSFQDANGNQTFTSHDRLDTVVIVNTGSAEADLKLSSTSGHHYYSIVIGDGDPVVAETIAYLYTGATDGVYQQLQAREGSTVTAIDVATTTLTAEALREYSLVVIAPSVPADNAVTAVVKEALPYVPMLNLNANLYPAWTYGVAVAITEPLGVVTDAKSTLLNGVELQQEEDLTFIEIGAGTSGVQLGDYFQGDETPLTTLDGETVVAHSHNIDHNGYVFFAGAAENPAPAQSVIANAIDLLLSSKAEVTKAPTPGVVLEYKDKNTNVTLTASKALTKPHIYYTLDGSTPTESSTEYTEVINVTQPTTIKAVVIAEGYLLSDVTTRDIDIKEQPKTPVVTTEEQDGKTIVTITCESADENTPIYFNTSGSTDIIASEPYTEPFTITMPQDIYAFAVANEAVWSEVAYKRALVKNPHVAVDIVAHFYSPANWIKQTDGETVLGNNGNIFAAGTNDNFTMWKEGTGRTETDPETGDEITVYDEIDWVTSDEPLETPEWMAMTKNEGVLWQNNKPSLAHIGDNDGIYPVSSLDIDSIFKATDNNLCFYRLPAGERPTAAIQSKNKYAGPFDVVMIDNMGSGKLMIQVSADGENWTQIGDTINSTGYSRMWQKHVAQYDGNDEVYVRVTQPANGSSGPKIYDIYVAKAGEQSAALLAALTDEYNNGTGIIAVSDKSASVAKGIYNINGIRQNGLKRGLNIIVNGDGSVRKVMVK